MTVYDQISANKTRTILIVVLFIALVSGFFYLIGKYFDSPLIYFTFGVLFSLFSVIGSYFHGDKLILYTVGAKPANKKDYFDFYTVTENLAMADGLPMPKLYVIDDPAPNAFATGRDKNHSVVCATTGILDRLDRTELEGVIAHELSHVKNHDILLSSMVAVLVGTVAVVSNWLFWRGRFSRSDDERRSGNPIMFVLFIIAIIIGPLVATLIQLAMSRRREFLADASGVLLTRYPEGLARALEKISDNPHILRTATTSTAHLFISNPFKKKTNTNSWLTSLFDTHPPTAERIKILRSM
jgi:heat shock protein HtpX